MEAVPGYSPSFWVRVCHALPRLDFNLQTQDNVFSPDSWEYQQVRPLPSPRSLLEMWMKSRLSNLEHVTKTQTASVNEKYHLFNQQSHIYLAGWVTAYTTETS